MNEFPKSVFLTHSDINVWYNTWYKMESKFTSVSKAECDKILTPVWDHSFCRSFRILKVISYLERLLPRPTLFSMYVELEDIQLIVVHRSYTFICGFEREIIMVLENL